MFHVKQHPFGVYVHVPFCLSKCGYCDFCRTTRMELATGYLRALEAEMRHSPLCGLAPRTVYLGGGTPSALGVQKLDRLLASVAGCFQLGSVEEFTVECNPNDVTPQLARMMAARGVNRVSLGCQSLCDPMLRLMGRRHSASEAVEAVDTLRAEGIDNISVDMIFGLPQLEGYDFEADVAKFAALGVPHLSAYALSYEPGSRFSQMLAQGSLSPTPDDDVARQYELLTACLAGKGYHHYEISNYALPGREAKHNSAYWDRTPYAGFGPGASSFSGTDVRRTNTHDVAEYIAAWTHEMSDDEKNDDGRRDDGRNDGGKINVDGLADLADKADKVGKADMADSVARADIVDIADIVDEERLTSQEIFEEVVMLRLRTSRGVDEEEVPRNHRAAFGERAARALATGSLQRTEEGRLRIPEQKWMVADGIIASLFD